MLLLFGCFLSALAWSPRLLEMSVSAPMQRRCCCSVVLLVLLAWSPRLLEMSISAAMQRHCCCSVVPLALLAWSPQQLMSASAAMQRCCCCSVVPLVLPAVMSPSATMRLPIVTISSFDWGISKSIGIGENHAATFFLQWAPLLIVVPPLFV
jgi:hypothetical protein